MMERELMEAEKMRNRCGRRHFHKTKMDIIRYNYALILDAFPWNNRPNDYWHDDLYTFPLIKLFGHRLLIVCIVYRHVYYDYYV